MWHTSDKLEYAARTIRNKIHTHLPAFLQEFPPLKANKADTAMPTPIDWVKAKAFLEVDRTVKEVSWCEPGYAAGMAAADDFGKKRLAGYSDKRNDPNANGISKMSPYYHFGQVCVGGIEWKC